MNFLLKKAWINHLSMGSTGQYQQITQAQQVVIPIKFTQVHIHILERIEKIHGMEEIQLFTAKWPEDAGTNDQDRWSKAPMR